MNPEDLKGRAYVVQAVAILALYGPQKSREVADRLPWIDEPLKVSTALSNAAAMGYASRTGSKWSISYDGRRYLRDRLGVDIGAPEPTRKKELPPAEPIRAEECRPWAAACASRYGR